MEPTKLAREDVVRRVVEALTAEERQSGAAYLDDTSFPEGATVDVGRRTVTASWPAWLAFVDREPQANWGHACRYLLIHRTTGDTQSIDAEWPPFLRGVPDTLHLVWQGPAVPDWAVVGRRARAC